MTWIRRNMFRSVGDSIVSIAVAALAGYVIWQLFQFIFITGRWEIIEVNLKLLLVGRFPEELMWMLGASIIALAFWIGAVAASSTRDATKSKSIGQAKARGEDIQPLLASVSDLGTKLDAKTTLISRPLYLSIVWIKLYLIFSPMVNAVLLGKVQGVVVHANNETS